MRVGEENSSSISSSSSNNGAPSGGAAERYRLSFDRHAPNSRVGGSRRVFARLAPHNSRAAPAPHSRTPRPTDTAAGGPGIGGGADAADSDGLGDADRYFERQMRQLPTTPAHRMVHSDSEADSDSGSDDDDVGRDSAEDWRVHQALEQFGQLRRQRFLRDQRQWHNAEITRASTGEAAETGTPLHSRSRARMGSETPPVSHDAPPQLFPSNDVDSYWYNQPPAAARQLPSAEPGAAHPATLRRLGHLPQVPRNPAAELSRSAMLEVLRTHRGFAASHDGTSSTEDSESARTQQQTPVAAARVAADELEPRRNEKAEAQDGGDAGTEDVAAAPTDAAAQATQRQQQGCARVEGRMLR
ncbi:hypothetical protein H4R20_006456, partial [Coemansia guatemalensis]